MVDEMDRDDVLELFSPDPRREDQTKRRIARDLLVVFLLALMASLHRERLGSVGAPGGARTAPQAAAGDVYAAAELFSAVRAEALVRELSKTTRRVVSKLINKALEERLTFDQFRERLKASGVFGEVRARLTAETEFVRARNRGAAAAFRSVGVQRVRIVDGTQDDACREANGQEWDLSRFIEEPIAHPNCRRSAHAIAVEVAA